VSGALDDLQCAAQVAERSSGLLDAYRLLRSGGNSQSDALATLAIAYALDTGTILGVLALGGVAFEPERVSGRVSVKRRDRAAKRAARSRVRKMPRGDHGRSGVAPRGHGCVNRGRRVSRESQRGGPRGEFYSEKTDSESER
jgi:hypothetical protein